MLREMMIRLLENTSWKAISISKIRCHKVLLMNNVDIGLVLQTQFIHLGHMRVMIGAWTSACSGMMTHSNGNHGVVKVFVNPTLKNTLKITVTILSL
jgi:hypothetical protein